MVPGMGAGRTFSNRLLAFMQVAAVAASPGDLRIPFKYPAGFYICRQVPVPLFVLLFGHSYSCENICNFFESFCNGRFGKSGIHGGVFVIFTGSSLIQVFQGGADDARRKTRGNLSISTLEATASRVSNC